MISMDNVIPATDLEEEPDVYLLVIGSFFDREEEWGEDIIADDKEDAITGWSFFAKIRSILLGSSPSDGM